jgi:hypothetical protein
MATMDVCSARGTRLYDVGRGRDGAGSSRRVQAVGGRREATTGARALRTFPVEVRDGAIWLVG